MSGIEIAGLILGGLPLVISALEHYNNGLDPIKAFYRWERELPQYIRKLRNQHVHYQQTLRLLLEPITDEHELADMIANADAPAWTDDRIAQALEERLGDSYVAYGDTVAEISRVMRTIASKLDVGSTNTSRSDLEALLLSKQRPSGRNGFEWKKRIKFGMSKRAIKTLLDELDGYVKELERFTERGEKLESQQAVGAGSGSVSGTWKTSFVAPLEHVRAGARLLHQAMTQWNCACEALHSTHIKLEQRVIVSRSKTPKRPKNADELRFRVSVTTAETTFKWNDVEVSVRHTEPESPPPEYEQNLPELKHSATAISAYSVKSVSTMKSSLTMKSSVTFSVTAPSIPPSVHDLSLLEIDNICHTLRQASRTTPLLGFCLDPSGKLRGIYPVSDEDTTLKPPPQGTITLDELLRSPVIKGKRARLSRKDRLALAVNIASSTLQLCTTPWLPAHCYCASDIVFPRTDGSPAFDIESAYLRSTPYGPDTKGTKPLLNNDNATLLALGLMLLELYFGESSDTHTETEDLGPNNKPNAFTALAVAQRWVLDERDNLSAGFLQAVSHCLRCFADPRSSLHDPPFLQAAIDEIIVPLQVELWQFTGAR